MYCNTCEQNPCTCQKALAVTKGSSWIIQHCSIAECTVAIRERVGQQSPHPICKWHQLTPNDSGKPAWPAGMPDPDLPWPWMTDRERERKVALPYWQARFRQHASVYAQWIQKLSDTKGADVPCPA